MRGKRKGKREIGRRYQKKERSAVLDRRWSILQSLSCCVRIGVET